MNNKTTPYTAFLIWACITLFYCYQYILRTLPNIIMPELIEMFEIGATQFGSFAGIYYIGYIAMHIPLGVCIISYGPRITLAVCALLTTLGLLPIIYCDAWLLVKLGRLLTGIGSSAAIVGALQVFRILYPNSSARALGVSAALGLITVVYSGKYIASFIDLYELEFVIQALVIIGLILSLTIYAIMPQDSVVQDSSQLSSEIISVLRNKKLILVSIFSGFMVGPMEGFADAWGSSFLMSAYGSTKETANSIVLAIFLGMCGGCFVMPAISDRLKSSYGITVFCGLIMAVSFYYMLLIPKNIEIVHFLCIIIGFFCSYQIIIISKIATFTHKNLSGMAAAIANMIVMVFGWFFHNIIGYRLELQIEGIGDKAYNADMYATSLNIIPLAIIIGITGLAMISIYESYYEKK